MHLLLEIASARLSRKTPIPSGCGKRTPFAKLPAVGGDEHYSKVGGSSYLSLPATDRVPLGPNGNGPGAHCYLLNPVSTTVLVLVSMTDTVLEYSFPT